MHMYGSQLPRRLLSKGIPQEHTPTNTLLNSTHTYMPIIYAIDTNLNVKMERWH
jgi:hypothetical protein